MPHILAINPGSTSTKIAVYKDASPLFTENITHTPGELSAYSSIIDQYSFRFELILAALEKHSVPLDSIDVVVGRGGLLPALDAGAYLVDEKMLEYLRRAPRGEHASNLGAFLAKGVADKAGVNAYIYDPVTVDEMIPVTRVTGLPSIQRRGMAHNLNMRACAIKYAEERGKKYTDLTLIVGHLGGGFSFTLHDHGKMIDMVSDDEGPFSPERVGGIPSFALMNYVLEAGLDAKAFMRKFRGQSGLIAHCHTTDAREIEESIRQGDAQAALVYEAMILNIAKALAGLSTVVFGNVEAIILTGGLAYSNMIVEQVTKRVRHIAPVVCMPGENEMAALAAGALRMLKKTEKANVFPEEVNAT
ncbi:butyrate kinase [Desulfovibrio sp. 86]|uniref:Probable butyrate kinase n=1 Tax=uncultured Desulfovibrio sp. TaxID=167968 RepID=A0A212L281_9BACT|nr:butyrate kinase [Desulfovibrio sp. 86]SCM71655.1 putative butyrate kinase 1 [uncultured Desulfovibrio sp.]VZH33008.1 Butyrate kinase 1 [Desulfovibrio sp. 86]